MKEKILKKKLKCEKKTTRNIIDDEKTKIKNYIYIINFVVVAKRSLDIYLHQKSYKLYKKSVKSFS